MPDFVQALPPSEFVEAIALAFGVQREDYQLGMYKIFMRAGKAAFLEELKDANLDEMVPSSSHIPPSSVSIHDPNLMRPLGCESQTLSQRAA